MNIHTSLVLYPAFIPRFRPSNLTGKPGFAMFYCFFFRRDVYIFDADFVDDVDFAVTILAGLHVSAPSATEPASKRAVLNSDQTVDFSPGDCLCSVYIFPGF